MVTTKGLPDLIRAAVDARGLAVSLSQPEPLASLDYADELAVKQQAMGALWHGLRLPGRPETIVPSPEPRGYRSTSKRRVRRRGGQIVLTFEEGPAPAEGLAPSRLDRPEHAAVYRAVLDRLRRPPSAALSAAISYVIVRGTGSTLALILNVRAFDGAVVRGAKLLGDAMAASGLGVQSAFLYLDPTGSDYYLEARRPRGEIAFKRLFGPEWLEVVVEGVRLRFPATAFSQVNTPMLPVLTGAARSLLAPLGGCAFLDLYCGYGLFSLTLGRAAAEVLGIDSAAPAIEAARANARHAPGMSGARFIAGRIEGGLLRRLRPSRAPLQVLLDPPRQGTAEGVALAVATRRPERVLHVCCGAEEIPREVAAWEAASYHVQRVVPLDMFAGTASLETLILLAR